MKVLLAQFNPIVGDLIGNANRLKIICKDAARNNADLVVTPELSLWGYPPKDLLLIPYYLEKQKQALEGIIKAIQLEEKNISILIGIAEKIEDNFSPNLFNSVVLASKNGYEIVARKQLLPEYDVFEEKRYFRSGEHDNYIHLKVNKENWCIGLTICEDIWVDSKVQTQRIHGPDPIEKLIPKKIDLLINLSASPFSQEKIKQRNFLGRKAVERLNCPFIYINQVGGNDELIFDGSSFVLNKSAETILSLQSCQEDFKLWDTENIKKSNLPINLNPKEELFKALVLGTRDYASKCGFKSALIGLSGGIDSALVAIIAAAALGAENLTSVLMPSPWNSPSSTNDAIELTKRLNSCSIILPITSLMKAFELSLQECLGEAPKGITAENLQSRIRGTLLMGLANQKNHLLLATGNKSELAVGYCTLYGDMNGALAVIGDLYKTEIFELCEWIDSDSSKDCRAAMGLPKSKDLIGRNIREKAPSAELRPGQLDTDSLPNYSVLDLILKALIERKESPTMIERRGIDRDIIKKVIRLLKKGEFKRYQAPPLLKVSDQSLGSGWKVPIAAK